MRKKKPWSPSLALWLIPPNLLFTSTVPSSNMEEDPSAPAKQVAVQPDHLITPAVAPRVMNSVNVTTSADFIWWKTYLENTEYGWAGVVDTIPASQAPSKGNIKNPHYHFAPGFKVGLGLTFSYDGWDLFARYTWLDAKGNAKTVANLSARLLSVFPLLLTDNVPGAATQLICSWKQQFNVLDLELGRNFFISQRLSLRPHVGLKGDWIVEKIHQHCVSGLISEDLAFAFFDYIKKEKALGIGIRGGLNSMWHFCKNWGLYGDIAATALWSDFHLTFKEPVDLLILSQAPYLAANSYQRIQQVTPVLEAGLGLAYMLWFHNERALFFAKAGWEGQVWLDYNQLPQGLFSPKCGNLSLQGLTVELGVNF